ncbi:hypothetical protein C0J52_22482 [Blattella germanica]|nr:hypothetical protein C0J52_22482 [Blattella germanica]
MMLLLVNQVYSGPLAAAACYTTCTIAVTGCFAAVGFTFGTVPAAIVATTPALGACSTVYSACQTGAVPQPTKSYSPYIQVADEFSHRSSKYATGWSVLSNQVTDSPTYSQFPSFCIGSGQKYVKYCLSYKSIRRPSRLAPPLLAFFEPENLNNAIVKKMNGISALEKTVWKTISADDMRIVYGAGRALLQMRVQGLTLRQDEEVTHGLSAPGGPARTLTNQERDATLLIHDLKLTSKNMEEHFACQQLKSEKTTQTDISIYTQEFVDLASHVLEPPGVQGGPWAVRCLPIKLRTVLVTDTGILCPDSRNQSKEICFCIRLKRFLTTRTKEEEKKEKEEKEKKEKKKKEKEEKEEKKEKEKKEKKKKENEEKEKEKEEKEEEEKEKKEKKEEKKKKHLGLTKLDIPNRLSLACLGRYPCDPAR